MTGTSPYVALRAFRFGIQDLQPGDPVPVEAGRNYQMMLRLGQIAPAPEPAGQQETPPDGHTIHLPKGVRVVFVSQDGAHSLVQFLNVEEAPLEALEGLGLEPGARVALVTFPEDPDNATFVPMDSLLPEQPTRRLIEDLTAQARDAETSALAHPAPAQEQEIAALKGKAAFLELLVQAIRAEGTPLKPDTPSLKDLQANGLLTEEGLRLLAAGETGRANLIALDRIGEKTADKILAYLFPPAPPATPEG
ncbi:hypothetical protein [Deinococcus apachensis]|uniref:hypothetical protein n=1 Tax=Deinococcus apachensis TaxID=309886 RepID=UPI0012F8444E|nr:hypothetical protein [Deinococcus apachensis]